MTPFRFKSNTSRIRFDAWVRIHDQLDLACDTLENNWAVAKERRHALRDAFKAKRAACKALEPARIEDPQPGSPVDVEDCEALWGFLKTLAGMVLKRHAEQGDSVLRVLDESGLAVRAALDSRY